MALEKRNGHIEIVWSDDGQTPKGLAMHSHLFSAEGDFVKTVVEPLTAIDDPTVTNLASQWSAAVVAHRDSLLIERDTLTAARDSLASQVATLTASGNTLNDQNIALVGQVATLTTERDDARAQVDPLKSQVADLQAQLNALLHPPGPDLSTVEGAKQYISNERYSQETGGITVGGQFVSTERDEIGHWFPRFYDAMLWTQGDATVRAGNPNGLYPYKPKAHDPVILSAAQVVRVYQCIAWFINQCFAVEDTLYNSLNGGTPIADVLAEIPAAWPQTAFEWTPPA